MNTKTALQFAKDISADDVRAFARAVMEGYESAKDYNDFTVETEEGEYRFVDEDAIERIHREEIESVVDDCYLSDKNIPKMIKRYFDYDSFARDCRLSDGYGHHFSSYDGSEEQNGNYFMFRVN